MADYLAFLARHIEGGPEALFTDESPHAIGIEPVFAPHDGTNIVEDLYVKLGGELHRISSIAVFASSRVTKEPMQLRYGILKEVYYGAGEVEIDGERTTLLVTKREGEGSRPILRSHPKPRASKKATKTYYFSEHEMQGPISD
jgi:hypothetical protein